jgi:hypothetical protein
VILAVCAQAQSFARFKTGSSRFRNRLERDSSFQCHCTTCTRHYRTFEPAGEQKPLNGGFICVRKSGAWFVKLCIGRMWRSRQMSVANGVACENRHVANCMRSGLVAYHFILFSRQPNASANVMRCSACTTCEREMRPRRRLAPVSLSGSEIVRPRTEINEFCASKSPVQ